MRLYYSPASPFARKCRILLREKGMLARVEELRVDPLSDPDLRRVNPLSQVPVLVDDAGVVWTDSPVICARLDEIGGAPKLIPDGDARWPVIRREVIADGIMEVGVKWRLESIRPEGERSQTWMARWRDGVLAAIAAADAQTPGADTALDIASVAAVCAVTWLDLRFPDLGWRSGAPKLAALQEKLEKRSSFAETRPS